VKLTRFASTDELTRAEGRAAPIRSYPRPTALAEPLKGLDALAIETLGDLIEHFPHSHRDRSLQDIASLAIGQDATVAATVRSVAVKPMRNRRQKRVEARVFDHTGPLVASGSTSRGSPASSRRARTCCCTGSFASEISSG